MSYCIINHEWEGTDEGEMSIEVGDIIRITQQDDSGWWQGVIEEKGISGIFPSNFSDPYTPPVKQEQEVKQETNKGESGEKPLFKVKAISEYIGNSDDDELSFAEGDIIRVYAMDESGWWQGRNESDMDVISWFPSNFVEEFNEKSNNTLSISNPNINVSTTNNNTSKPKIVVEKEDEDDSSEEDIQQKLDSVTQDSQKLRTYTKSKRKTQPPSNPRNFAIGSTVEVVERVEVVEPPSEEESQPRRPPMGIPMGMGGLAINLSELKGKLSTGLKKTTKSEIPSKIPPKGGNDENPLPFKGLLKSNPKNPPHHPPHHQSSQSNPSFPLKSPLKSTNPPLKNPGLPPNNPPQQPQPPPSSSHPQPKKQVRKSVQLPQPNHPPQHQQPHPPPQHNNPPPSNTPPQPTPPPFKVPPPQPSNPNNNTSNNNETPLSSSQPIKSPFKLPPITPNNPNSNNSNNSNNPNQSPTLPHQQPPQHQHQQQHQQPHQPQLPSPFKGGNVSSSQPLTNLPSKPKIPPPSTPSSHVETTEESFHNENNSRDSNHSNNSNSSNENNSDPVGWPTDKFPSWSVFVEELNSLYLKHKSNSTGKNVYDIHNNNNNQKNNLNNKIPFVICIKTKDGKIKKINHNNNNNQNNNNSVCNNNNNEEYFNVKEIGSALLMNFINSNSNNSNNFSQLSSLHLHSPSLSHFPLDSVNEKPLNLFTSKGFSSLSSFSYPLLGKTKGERINNVLEKTNGMTKEGRVSCSMSKYLEMREKEDILKANVHLLSLSQSLPSSANQNISVEEVIDFSLQVASIEMNSETLCDVLLHLSAETVEEMKVSSGFNVPLLSSSSGVTLLLYKNLFSLVVFSPLVDKNGNSVRGLSIAKEIIQKYF